MDELTKEEFLEHRKEYMEVYFSQLNDKQREAVFQIDGPLLILAGAGSGKTTVIVNRIANILKFGNAYYSDKIYGEVTSEDITGIKVALHPQKPSVDLYFSEKLVINRARPWEILAITFTNKAARELKNRLFELIGEDAGDIWASTFHSSCARILRRFADRLGYNKDFTVYDTDDVKRLIKLCQKDLHIDDKILSYKTIISRISKAKDEMLSPKSYLESDENDSMIKDIAKVYDRYQTYLKEANAMDFDDLLLNTVKLLKQENDVLEYYQNKFKYVMVDEYQDTNKVQYEFVRLLTLKSKNLCVVGDDDQSIYKFRGATIENILQFEENFSGAKIIRLEQNYRSTKNILDAANSIISNNSNRKGKKLWTNNKRGNLITYKNLTNEKDEAICIAKNIQYGVKKGKKYSDYAILYRMNSQSNAIENAFLRTIPYRIIGGHRFYDRMEIRDVIAYLSVINNPDDEIRMRRIISKPRRSIGEKTIEEVSRIANGIGNSMIEIMRAADEFETLKRPASKLKNFAQMVDDLWELNNDPGVSLKTLYDEMLERSGYINYLNTEKESLETRLQNISELASNILNFEKERGEEATLSEFLEEVSLLTDVDSYDEDEDYVVMMTIHSAKGLEFPTVFLPGFEEGVFPGIQSTFREEDLEEERRLAYVAVTRAREELFILNAQARMIFGSTSINQSSRFLKEIPSELVQKLATRECEVPKRVKKDLPTFHPFYRSEGDKVSKFCAGDKVSHSKFGDGTVLSTVDMGNDKMLEVEFLVHGRKKLMSNYANLKHI